MFDKTSTSYGWGRRTTLFANTVLEVIFCSASEVDPDFSMLPANANAMSAANRIRVFLINILIPDYFSLFLYRSANLTESESRGFRGIRAGRGFVRVLLRDDGSARHARLDSRE